MESTEITVGIQVRFNSTVILLYDLMMNVFGLFLRLRDSLFFRTAKAISNSRWGKSKTFQNEEQQNLLFEDLGLERNSGIKHLNKTLASLGRSAYSEMSGMWSEHLVLFATLAISAKKVSSILEIGTFRGETTIILSKLFPQATITTLDLPFEEFTTLGLYEKSSGNESFSVIKSRRDNLDSCSNVVELATSSVALTRESGSYDLIWVDGAHGYPVVAIDILNAYRLINEDGLVACDDVYLYRNGGDNMYFSKASLEVLKELQENNLVHLTLLFKRINIRFNYWKRDQKRLGVFSNKAVIPPNLI